MHLYFFDAMPSLLWLVKTLEKCFREFMITLISMRMDGFLVWRYFLYFSFNCIMYVQCNGYLG